MLGVTTRRFSIDGEEYAARSFPLLDEASPLPEGLTEAEQAVVRLVVLGRSNEDIAGERGTSVRTIANQLQSIYRKLKIASRLELVKLVTEKRRDR